ncbi:MAG: hotdog domain-containing protein [Anaerolineaceae bacterium]
MKNEVFTIHHLVKHEDLNHHRTLYAGRTAEWFVEAGFIAASSLLTPDTTVCLQIHGMTFSRPVRLGEITCFRSQVVLSGKSKLVSYIKMEVKQELVVEGFVTFIHVDAEGHVKPHGLSILPETEEERILHERAEKLFQ